MALLSTLRRLFTPRVPTPELHDTQLGLLRFSATIHMWRADLDLGGRQIVVFLGGQLEPDATLRRLAQDLVRNWASFTTELEAYLRSEADKSRAYHLRSEVRTLSASGVSFPWPQEPANFIVFLSGEPNARIWHLEYRGGRPFYLSCQ